MKTMCLILLMMAGGIVPALAQGRGPGDRPGFPFRYYQLSPTDSLIFRQPDPWQVPDRIYRDFKFNKRFHSAVPEADGMPVYRPRLRDKMPRVVPDSQVHFHLRVKPVPGGKVYK